MLASASRPALYPRSVRIEKSLAEINERLVKAREELHIAEEQLLFQMDVVEEAKTRAIVSETPLADREHQEAQADLGRMTKARDEARERITELKKEQDKLLDRMLD